MSREMFSALEPSSSSSSITLFDDEASSPGPSTYDSHPVPKFYKPIHLSTLITPARSRYPSPTTGLKSHLERRPQRLSRTPHEIINDIPCPPSAFHTRAYKPIDDFSRRTRSVEDLTVVSFSSTAPEILYDSPTNSPIKPPLPPRRPFRRGTDLPGQNGNASETTLTSRTRVETSPTLSTPRSPKRQSSLPRFSHAKPKTDDISRLAWIAGYISPSGSDDIVYRNTSRPCRRPSSPRRKKSSSNEVGRLASKPRLSTPPPSLTPQPVYFHQESVDSERHGGQFWTPAMIIMDETLTDEMLAEELEAIRETDHVWEHEYQTWNTTTFLMKPSSGAVWNIDHPICDCGGSLPQNPHRSSDPAQCPTTSTWSLARRALLISRELVRTERHYLSSLHTLLSGETISAPPPLMLSYLPALIRVSEEFLARIEQNASVQGVADAFLHCGACMETAFASWCGVVGTFFANEGTEPEEESFDDSNVGLKKRVGSWGRRMKPFSSSGTSAAVSIIISDVDRDERRPWVRDLAIQPSQRITRYVLLYKDLLVHTPTSLPCRSAVERALKFAIVNAQKANKAQENASFLSPLLR